MSHRTERVNELIKHELSKLINEELKDPRLENAVIGITRVKTTPDLRYSKVYISIYTAEGSKSEILELIVKAKGFLRKNIAAVLTTRYAPELVFELDESLDYAMHIEKVLKELNINEE